MTRRVSLLTLALAMLVANLTSTLLAAPALADQGQGQDKRYGEKRGQAQSDEQRKSRDDNRGNSNQARQHQSLSPQDAAQRARSQYGGQVLKIQPSGRGYEVRLLREDGRVVTVPVGD